MDWYTNETRDGNFMRRARLADVVSGAGLWPVFPSHLHLGAT